MPRITTSESPTARALRGWLIALNVGLLATGVALTMSGARRAMFLLAMVPVVFVPFAYARLRLHRRLARTGALRRWWVLTGIGMALDAVMVAQLLTARAPDQWSWVNGPLLSWVGPVWFSAHALLALGYGVLGLGRLLRRLLRLARLWPRYARHRGTVIHAQGSPVAGSGAAPTGALGRRAFLQQLGLAGAAAPFVVSLSGVGLSYDFRLDEHELELPNWPPALDGLRVAHLSDIHVGGAMNRPRLREVVALTAAARPDLILHTGDFLTHRSGDFDAPLYEALAELQPPHGQWACLGNHDYDDPARLTRKLRGAGVTVLRDQVAQLIVNGHPLEIAGLDYQFGRDGRDAQYQRLLATWPPRRAPRLLLNHDPSTFTALPDDCADLVLSGHTHGGHIGIQLGAGHAITVVGLAGIPDQGVFRRGDLRLFVTRCVGFYGYPMRLGIPPEIALLVLRAPRA